MILTFCKNRRALHDHLDRCLDRLIADGGLWLCWPKKSSGVKTDIAEAQVRAAGLAAGLVDNKICAIDDDWSGLRFVVRRENRPPPQLLAVERDHRDGRKKRRE